MGDEMDELTRKSAIRYLGHAGFVVEHRGKRLLIDPWFFPAFLGAWFPYPDNRHLLDEVRAGRFDWLYVSHAHEDHYDEKLLSGLDRSTKVIVARYRSKVMVRRLRGLGFRDVTALGHRETMQLGPGLTATMFLDTSHSEDSGLLLDMDGFRFLDLNDCNTVLSELPTGIDLLAAQYSGAQYYPHCYDYPPRVMAEKVAEVRAGLLDTLRSKVSATGARAYLPSAGPACFLDPELAGYNDPDTTVFPRWDAGGRRLRPGLSRSRDRAPRSRRPRPRGRPATSRCCAGQTPAWTSRTSTPTVSAVGMSGRRITPARNRPSPGRRSSSTSPRSSSGTSGFSAISARTSVWSPAPATGTSTGSTGSTVRHRQRGALRSRLHPPGVPSRAARGAGRPRTGWEEALLSMRSVCTATPTSTTSP